MENKQFGYVLLGVAIIVVVIIFLFQGALQEIVATSCGSEHSVSCPMNTTIRQQTTLALTIVGLIVLIGLVLIFSKPKEKVVVKKVKEKKIVKKVDLSSFRHGEKEAYKIIKEEKTIFQGELLEKTGFGKAKMTRVLDKLEGHGLIERKRRGLTNVVVLKED